MARHSTDICYLPIYLPSCISLHLTKLTRTMQCCGYAYHGTVVLRIGLRAISSQKKSAQIGHVWPDNREQFRVRAQGPGKEFRAWRGSGNEQRCSRGDFRWLRAQRVRCLCDEKQLHNGLRMEAYNLIVHSDIQFLMNLHQ